MPRSIWNGTISFGLVSIPVGLHTATSEKDIRFNQLHKQCGSRIRLQKYCPTCERVVENDELERGYELSKSQYVIVTDEDFEQLPVPSKHAIEVVAFVKAAEVDPIYYDTTYYIEPTETGKKPLALMVKALEEKGVVAVGKIAVRSKENLCLLRAADGGIVMETLYWPDEIRKPEESGLGNVKVDEKELKMALSLVDLLSGDFNPEEFKDEYRQALLERIEAKAHGQQLVNAPEPKEARVVNLMDALKASLEQAQKTKSKSG